MRAAVVATLVALSAGCESTQSEEPTVSRERSQAVMGSATSGSATAVASAQPPVTGVSATSSAKAPKPPRKLCGGPAESAKAFPKNAVGFYSGGQVSERAVTLAKGFTWINFWAAWCGPCKEEIPRLKSFENRFEAAGLKVRLVFVSLDDDQRQLELFVGSQPESGLKQSFWLREGREREQWLDTTALPSDPELPQQLILDAGGRTVCHIQGALEDDDYAAMAAVLRGG
jgi:thiol-disulfide isomerase/thioredoxin